MGTSWEADARAAVSQAWTRLQHLFSTVEPPPPMPMLVTLERRSHAVVGDQGRVEILPSAELAHPLPAGSLIVEAYGLGARVTGASDESVTQEELELAEAVLVGWRRALEEARRIPIDRTFALTAGEVRVQLPHPDLFGDAEDPEERRRARNARKNRKRAQRGKPRPRGPQPISAAVRHRCRGLLTSAIEEHPDADLELADLEEEIDRRIEANPILSSDDYQRVMALEVAFGFVALDLWLESGDRIVDQLLRRNTLSADERRYLTQARDSELRIYRIIDVRPGESLTLMDLESNESLRVLEKTASRTLRLHDGLLARVFDARGLFPNFDLGMLPVGIDALDFYLEMRADETEWPPEEQSFAAEAALEWLTFRAPSLHNREGHPIVMATAHFEAPDAAAATQALDDAAELERTADGRWEWHHVLDAGETVIAGWFALKHAELRFETNSEERAARARRWVDDNVPGATFKATSLTDPLSAMGGERPAREPLTGEIRDAGEEMLLEHYVEYYESWLAEPVPALGGATPREACARPALEPQLLDLLRGLDQMYQRQLEAGEPAFDPSWLWQELSCDDQRFTGELPAPAHERMGRLVEGLGEVVTQLADRVRRERGENVAGIVGRDDVEADLGARQLLRRADQPDTLARWIEILASWRLHRDKLFAVDPRLCTLLGATDMTLPVDALRSPFPAFALIFDDRLTLGLAERAVARHDDVAIRGRLLRRLTVHTRDVELPSGHRGLSLAFMLDAGQVDEPALLTETLTLEEETNLDSALDAVGGGPAMRDLIAFVVAVICYATSRDARVEPRPTPSPTLATSADRPFLVADEVIFLPLPIDISHADVIALVRQRRVGGSQVVRYMVRGHWRRANEKWKDQRPRWIAPHWRGPSAAAILERPYRLRCAEAPPSDGE